MSRPVLEVADLVRAAGDGFIERSRRWICWKHVKVLQVSLGGPIPNVARVLVKRVRVERTRRFGDCYLGLELWKRLGLGEFFAQHVAGELLFRQPQERQGDLLCDSRTVPVGITLLHFDHQMDEVCAGSFRTGLPMAVR